MGPWSNGPVESRPAAHEPVAGLRPLHPAPGHRSPTRRAGRAGAATRVPPAATRVPPAATRAGAAAAGVCPPCARVPAGAGGAAAPALPPRVTPASRGEPLARPPHDRHARTRLRRPPISGLGGDPAPERYRLDRAGPVDRPEHHPRRAAGGEPIPGAVVAAVAG